MIRESILWESGDFISLNAIMCNTLMGETLAEKNFRFLRDLLSGIPLLTKFRGHGNLQKVDSL